MVQCNLTSALHQTRTRNGVFTVFTDPQPTDPRGDVSLKASYGMRDWYPEDLRKRQFLFDNWRSIAGSFGFEEYDSPVLERAELYERNGEELNNQTFKVLDKEDSKMVLRPEMTASLARLVINLTDTKGEMKGARLPLKWFSLPACWRCETTQRGRRREFYQWNMDIVGEASVTAEVELLCACVALFRRLRLTPSMVQIRIGSRKLLEELLSAKGVPPAAFAQAATLLDKNADEEETKSQLTSLGIDINAADGILRALEAQTACEFATRMVGPTTSKSAGGGQDSRPALVEVEELLRLGAAYGIGEYLQFDPSTVRGLGYYTGIVFEAFDTRGELRAICGGGRYDRLTESMSGGRCSISMVGFGMGDCVLMELLQDRGLLPALPSSVDVVVAMFDTSMREPAMQVAAGLRAEGLKVNLLLVPKRARAAFTAASRCNATFTALVAPNEWANGLVAVKYMNARELLGKELQINAPVDNLTSLSDLFKEEAARQEVQIEGRARVEIDIMRDQ